MKLLASTWVVVLAFVLQPTIGLAEHTLEEAEFKKTEA